MAGPVYSWRKNNSFELLIDGTVFFPRIIREMESARTSIDVELYLVSSGQSSDRVIATLIDAVKRGVRVRCLLDSLGSQEMSSDDRERLLDAGVELRFYNPLRLFHWLGNLHRDHRKLLLIDNSLAFIGGTGFTDEFCKPVEDGHCLWHEQMLAVRGPVVADWLDLFERQWDASATGWRRQPAGRARGAPPPAPPLGNGYARVSYADSTAQGEVLQSLLAVIARSERRVWLATPYFLPAWRVRRALMRAARRGVDVRLLLGGQKHDHPSIRYAGQQYFARLLGAGVRIFEYQPRFLHLKTVLVDDWVSLGSCNFDNWSLHWNLEANQNIVDAQLAKRVQDSFETDMAQSHEWTRQSWKALPRWHRFKILLWSRLNKLVSVWFNVRR